MEGAEALVDLVRSVGVSGQREDAAHILSRNDEVDEWNKRRLMTDPQAAGPVVTCRRPSRSSWMA